MSASLRRRRITSGRGDAASPAPRRRLSAVPRRRGGCGGPAASRQSRVVAAVPRRSRGVAASRRYRDVARVPRRRETPVLSPLSRRCPAAVPRRRVVARGAASSRRSRSLATVPRRRSGPAPSRQWGPAASSPRRSGRRRRRRRVSVPSDPTRLAARRARVALAALLILDDAVELRVRVDEPRVERRALRAKKKTLSRRRGAVRNGRRRRRCSRRRAGPRWPQALSSGHARCAPHVQRGGRGLQ